MAIEDHGNAYVISHALAKHTLSEIRSVETEQVGFRQGLIELGRICGYEIIDGMMDTEYVAIQTPLADTTGELVKGLEHVVIVNILRAATPFVEGLLKVFPNARQGVISAGRNESDGMEDGRFPIKLEYVKLPNISEADTVIVADPMLATGSTMSAVLERVLEAGEPERILALSAVSAPDGLDHVRATVPRADLLTVSIDERLDEDGYIVPGLGDAGDRAFGTN